MCGILVYISPDNPISEKVFNSHLQRLDPRGPDERWMMKSQNFAAGMTRLSIFKSKFNLSRVNSSVHDVIVLLNGELWNFDSLAVEFETQDSLTEYDLIRNGYLRYGIDYISRLDGVFLITIIDRLRKKAFFVRDPLGVKPAFYFHDSEQNTLLVSSDIKAIIGFDRLNTELNINYLRNQGLFHFTDFDDCIVTGIKQIPPQMCLSVSLDSAATFKIDLQGYQSNIKHEFQPGSDVMDTQLALLEQAVLKRYQHADSYPIGLLLSGGIDSSLLAFIARRLDLENIICIFLGSIQNPDYKWAKKVARLTGYPLERIPPSAPEVIQNLPRYCHGLSGESGFIGMHFSDCIRRLYPSMKVVLCGEGADELYGGYSCYNNPKRYFQDIRSSLSTKEKDTGFMERVRIILDNESNTENSLEALFDFFLNEQLVNNHLLQLDHAFMANGIELRVPYLDLENVTFIKSLPLSFRVSGTNRKTILKKLLRRISNISENNFISRAKVGLPGAIPSSLVDVEAYAEAIIPTAWAAAHPYRRWFESYFQMMWFDLAQLVLIEGRGHEPDGVSILELYRSDKPKA